MTDYWYIVLCSLTVVDQRFTRAYCLHHSGNEEAANERFATNQSDQQKLGQTKEKEVTISEEVSQWLMGGGPVR
jgi:hypothetical protein